MLSQHINKIKWPPCRKRAKKVVTLKRSLFREIRELKSFAFNIKPISVIKVSYKHLMESENGGHTHTQSEYCNYCSCVCAPSVKKGDKAHSNSSNLDRANHMFLFLYSPYTSASATMPPVDVPTIQSNNSVTFLPVCSSS